MLPRPIRPIPRMPAPRASSKPPKAVGASHDLASLGFRVADSGPHTSKPLFRVLRRLWEVDPSAHPQLALLNGLARPQCQ